MVRSSDAGVFAILFAAFGCCYYGGSAQQYDTCTSGVVADIGNGRCDAELNVPSCGYDGGDCCPCTCVDGPTHSCSDSVFDCVYPECDEAPTSEETMCEEDWKADGWCDPQNNHPMCDYDGGDCCECSCVDTEDFTCGSSVTDSSAFASTENSFEFAGFACEDPACFDPDTVADFPDCTGDWLKIADGTCTPENNNALCGFDGGDCCLCSCSGPACAASPFDCLDPSAYGEFFNCEAPPPPSSPCSAEVQQAWVVETSAQVQALAAAVNCSGGSFEVEWRGSVIVDAPIYVVDGTVLTVSGSGQMDGNGSSQLFTVVNATLHVSGIDIIGGTGVSGGAIGAASSSLTFAQMNFKANFAAGNGGAVFLSDGSSASLLGATFDENSAYGRGGAIYASEGSSVSCAGDTRFTWNFAEFSSGGALYLSDSRASWGGDATFYSNWAGLGGGALYVTTASEVFWGGTMNFTDNGAYNGAGGALLIMNGSSVIYTGETIFSVNHAFTDGGAIGSPASDSISNPLDSTIDISGATTFDGNNCTANGGGLALLGGCSFVNTADVSFVGNLAGVAGGAVYVSSSGFGPTFSGVRFYSNFAQVGGAASVSGSGNTKNTNDVKPPNPTTFDRCTFVENSALATGGAIESAAGHDEIKGSVFRGNTARVGGALRLAGTADISNCSFVENLSADGEGAAVSNIGVISRMEGLSFSGNVFECPRDTFLNFTEFDGCFETACDGCHIGSCVGCSFDDPFLVPICTDVLEHSNSSGGTVTLEKLWIEPGFWRATETSTDILDCYNEDACLGGVTGSSGYCREGYEGPYCAICSDGYSSHLGFTCTSCSNSVGGIVLAAALLMGGLFIAVAVISYLMSGQGRGKGLGIVERVARYIPLQSVKIIIVAWQILSQFSSVANASYPDVYQRFLDILDVFNFDLGWVFSAGCVFDLDFHDRLLVSTIGPIFAILFLGGTYVVAAFISRGPPGTLNQIWNKHVFMVLLLTFLVYASVSSVLFKAFACEELDDGKNYLRADYRIECDSSRHKSFQIYAGFMVVLYAIGIPALYGALLFRDRSLIDIDDEARREHAGRVTPTSDLWRPYKPSAFYYEVVECARRILLAGVVVFIYPNTSAQIAVTLLMAFVFAMLAEGLAPYVSLWDTWISRMGHVVVFVSMYVALLMKVDVSNERANSQRVFEVVLIGVHVCMLLVVVVETLFLTCSLRAERREDKSLNSSRRCITRSFDESETAFEESNPYPGLPRSFFE